MSFRYGALSTALLATWVLPVVAGPPGNSAVGFVASKAGEQIQIEGNESSPVIISQLSVTCPSDGWLIVRAHGQFSVTDNNGDGATALQLALALDHPLFPSAFSDATKARSAWEFLVSGAQALPVMHTPIGGERVDPCTKGQASVYYFIGSQNNIGDETIAEQITLVAEFFRSNLAQLRRGHRDPAEGYPDE